MNAAGKQEVFFEAITPGEKDYTAIVSRLKQNGIDVVFLGGYHTEAGLIIRQMRGQGMKTILVGGDALVSSELGTIAGDDVEGTMMTFSPDPRKNRPRKRWSSPLRRKASTPRATWFTLTPPFRPGRRRRKRLTQRMERKWWML